MVTYALQETAGSACLTFKMAVFSWFFFLLCLLFIKSVGFFFCVCVSESVHHAHAFMSVHHAHAWCFGSQQR